LTERWRKTKSTELKLHANRTSCWKNCSRCKTSEKCSIFVIKRNIDL